MPKIPAICDKCGKAIKSDIGLKDATAHIYGHIEGSCDCGGTFRILDGTYTHLGGPINFCNAPPEQKAKFKEAAAEVGCG